jgi:hypothetical protein
MRTVHDLVADEIEQNPSLLRVPLENIERLLANGISASHRLEQWRGIILRAQKFSEGFQALLDLLRSRTEEAEHLKSFDPFPGVLTTAERRVIIAECAFAH